MATIIEKTAPPKRFKGDVYQQIQQELIESTEWIAIPWGVVADDVHAADVKLREAMRRRGLKVHIFPEGDVLKIQRAVKNEGGRK